MATRILRRPAVLDRTGLSKTGLHELVRAGDFPAPIAIGKRAVGWREDELDAWIESRPKARDGAKAAER